MKLDATKDRLMFDIIIPLLFNSNILESHVLPWVWPGSGVFLSLLSCLDLTQMTQVMNCFIWLLEMLHEAHMVVVMCHLLSSKYSGMSVFSRMVEVEPSMWSVDV